MLRKLTIYLKQRAFTGLTLVVLVLASVSTFTLTAAPAAHASTCSNAPSSALGTDSVTYSIPTTGTYTIWSRLETATATNNSYYLQIDCGSPISVGGANLPVNTWTWVNYQNGTTSSKITASLTSGSHTFLLTGEDPGVLVDRVVFATDPNCTPTGTGDNCAIPATTPTPTATPTATPTVTPTPTRTATPTPTANPTVGDVNGDARVNVIDLSSLLSHWAANYSAADFNHDGTVNAVDLSILLGHWTG